MSAPRLLADEDTGHALLAACRKLSPGFPMIHIADWRDGEWLGRKDPVLLASAKTFGLVLVSFDRTTLAHQAGQLVKTGDGHAGIIVYRKPVPVTAYGAQARLLVDLWREAHEWDWTDRTVYLPRA